MIQQEEKHWPIGNRMNSQKDDLSSSSSSEREPHQQQLTNETLLSSYKHNGFTRRRHLLFKVEGFDPQHFNGNAKLKEALGESMTL